MNSCGPDGTERMSFRTGTLEGYAPGPVAPRGQNLARLDSRSSCRATHQSVSSLPAPATIRTVPGVYVFYPLLRAADCRAQEDGRAGGGRLGFPKQIWLWPQNRLNGRAYRTRPASSRRYTRHSRRERSEGYGGGPGGWNDGVGWITRLCMGFGAA
jgi:hypothetical protein